ncbi:MAG: DNA polymerase III subunit delta [Ottowia sp.]|nr:DNA polymerase III subunit delta [Ottowia sp.]
MQINPAELSRHLQGALQPLYMVCGNEPLLLQEAADAIRAAARAAGFGARSVHVASGARFDWSEVLAASQSLNLFADRQLLEIRIPSGKPGKAGSDALQQLAAAAAGNAATLTLVLLPQLDQRTRATAWFAALAKAGAIVSVASIGRNQLPGWIAQRLAAQGQRVADGAEGQRTLQFFVDRVEGNLLAAHQEIQKLGLLYPPGVLRWEQVRQSVLDVARYDVFELSHAVLGGEPGRVLRMLDGLQAEGASPVLVHWSLADDIQALVHVKAAMAAGTPLPMALRQNRVWGPRERLIERVLPRISERRAVRLLRAAHQVDGVIKGLHHPRWPADPWQALARLAIVLCRQCRPGHLQRQPAAHQAHPV